MFKENERKKQQFTKLAEFARINVVRYFWQPKRMKKLKINTKKQKFQTKFSILNNFQLP